MPRFSNHVLYYIVGVMVLNSFRIVVWLFTVYAILCTHVFQIKITLEVSMSVVLLRYNRAIQRSVLPLQEDVGMAQYLVNCSEIKAPFTLFVNLIGK